MSSPVVSPALGVLQGQVEDKFQARVGDRLRQVWDKFETSLRQVGDKFETSFAFKVKTCLQTCLQLVSNLSPTCLQLVSRLVSNLSPTCPPQPKLVSGLAPLKVSL